MEENILYKNPFLKDIFNHAQFLFPHPIAISQISFQQKESIENHVLMVGDSAGSITPLCGNGMSMAMHASKLAFEQVDLFLQKKINRTEMETQYQQAWKQQFSTRLATGRINDYFSLKPLTSIDSLQEMIPNFLMKKVIFVMTKFILLKRKSIFVLKKTILLILKTIFVMKKIVLFRRKFVFVI